MKTILRCHHMQFCDSSLTFKDIRGFCITFFTNLLFTLRQKGPVSNIVLHYSCIAWKFYSRHTLLLSLLDFPYNSYNFLYKQLHWHAKRYIQVLCYYIRSQKFNKNVLTYYTLLHFAIYMELILEDFDEILDDKMSFLISAFFK